MSTESSATIVSKVWNYAHVLKNAGVGFGPAWRGIEQIIYLLFLKLAPPSLKLRRAGSEMTELGFYPPSPKLFGGTSKPIPAEFQWSELSGKSGKSGDPPSPSAFAKASADKRLRLAGELEPNGARWTFWKDCEVVQQPVARVRWSSNLVLLKKLATEPKPSLAA